MKRVVRSFIHMQATVAAFVLGLFMLNISPVQVSAFGLQEAELMIKNTCSTCHKFEGKEESRFNLKAPDLMWGGDQVSAGLADRLAHWQRTDVVCKELSLGSGARI